MAYLFDRLKAVLFNALVVGYAALHWALQFGLV